MPNLSNDVAAIQPWMITSWPIIQRSSDLLPELADQLRHLGTVISHAHDEFGRLLGHTIWGVVDVQIGLAWDWTETLDGVFALSDPMGVISNIGFVDDKGERISEPRAAVQFNRITHELPWQAEIVKVTKRVRTLEPWLSRAKPPRNVQFRASELGGLTPMHR